MIAEQRLYKSDTNVMMIEYQGNLDPDKIAMVKQGKQLLWDKHYQEAVDVFTAAINRYPNYAEAYMGRAYSNYALGADGDTVIADFRNAEAAYRQRGQPEFADTTARSIQQYRREKLGLQ
jgi:Flp pilus assembly protein TadD